MIASFVKVAGIAGGGEIKLLDQKIDTGSNMAVETGVETGTLVIAGHEALINHLVTNVFRQVDENRKLAHHHADVSEAMLEILKRLSAAA